MSSNQYPPRSPGGGGQGLPPRGPISPVQLPAPQSPPRGTGGVRSIPYHHSPSSSLSGMGFDRSGYDLPYANRPGGPQSGPPPVSSGGRPSSQYGAQAGEAEKGTAKEYAGSTPVGTLPYDGDEYDGSESLLGRRSTRGSSPTRSTRSLLPGIAEGDFITPTSRVGRSFVSSYAKSFIFRWLVVVLPVLAILWIPGALSFTLYPKVNVASVPLLLWSIWFSVAWLGWWIAAIVARWIPAILRNTVGVIFPETRLSFLYLSGIHFNFGAAIWAFVTWISFTPIIMWRQVDASANQWEAEFTMFRRALMAIFIVLMILLGEKLAIQVIAYHFHARSYADRIESQKFCIKILSTLYLNSSDKVPFDTGSIKSYKRQGLKSALKATKRAAQTGVTIIGTVASEIAGESLLQPNSAGSKVIQALSSSNKTRQLARRIFYSYVRVGRDALEPADISSFFANDDTSERAFELLDRDGNGDVTLKELEEACLEIHSDRHTLAESMRDIDSAVHRLDSILVSVWYVIAGIIIAALLDTSFQMMLASAGTVILGLSWLIGLTAQEVIASTIFLFVKHPYDVGDEVEWDGTPYIVKEMHLLSSVFQRKDGIVVQAPHNLLVTKPMTNIRRTGFINEKFRFDLDFTTPLPKIESLEKAMLEFLKTEPRDFIPECQIDVINFEGQRFLQCETVIKYKANARGRRRNKWCLALKRSLAKLEMWGPGGAGRPPPPPGQNKGPGGPGPGGPPRPGPPPSGGGPPPSSGGPPKPPGGGGHSTGIPVMLPGAPMVGLMMPGAPGTSAGSSSTNKTSEASGGGEPMPPQMGMMGMGM
ncbi:hypothetical protein T439DRAFT_381144 [Meredithblackwellia eburnea MCA 4105]